ncbi:MAG: NAD-dependent epimerase/dehydratase family protein [Armatimonadota bacterium]
MKVLVTGGAGFIGSHTADALLAAGHQVRALDSLEPQVHGDRHTPPSYLSPEVDFIRGDVRDADLLRRALQGVNAVCHLAAAVGVAQSMYEIRRYVDANCVGTAALLEAIAHRRNDVERLVVASSMSVYGEGEYLCQTCGPAYPELRREERLARGEWEHTCPRCGAVVAPQPTNESKPLRPTSPYAISKRDQEELCLTVGAAYGLPTTALRYFNVYGPRQALSNPYTGIGAIFASRILNNRPPVVFEDGLQSRDFVHVSDVARANLLALTAPKATWRSVNIGTGRPTTVLAVAETLIRLLNPAAASPPQRFPGEVSTSGSSAPARLAPSLPGQHRAGDIRHCFADVTSARELLGFEAQVSLEQGLAELAPWLAGQQPQDGTDQAIGELESRGLTR